MSYYTRSDVTLELGLLGDIEAVVTYLWEPAAPETLVIEQIWIQIGPAMVDIWPALSDEAVEVVAQAILDTAGGGEAETPPEDADELLIELITETGHQPD